MIARRSNAWNRSGRAGSRALGSVVVFVLMWSVGPAQESELDEEAPANNSRPGLIAVYHDGVQTISRIDSQFAFLLHADESPHPLIDSRRWEAAWTGAIDIRTPGRYRFAAEVQGQFELTVAGKIVLKADAPDGKDAFRHDGVPIDLPFGLTTITAHFRKGRTSGAKLRLFVQRPDGFEESVLPASFQHAAADETDLLDDGKQFDAGRELLASYACLACHDWSAESADRLGVAPMLPGRLEPAVAHVRDGWLEAWLANPQKTRTDGRMPRLFGDEPTERVDLAATLAVLNSCGPDKIETHQAAEDLRVPGDNAARMAEGRAVFAATGCAACHALPGKTKSVAPHVRQLDDVGAKYSRVSLQMFLFGELDQKEDGDAVLRHRPRLDLSALERAKQESLLDLLLSALHDLSAETSLSDLSGAAVSERFNQLVMDNAERRAFESLAARERLIQLGKVVMQRRRCAMCHGESEPSADHRDITTFEEIIKSTSEAAIRTPGGCLSAAPDPGIPDFGLSANERAAIFATLRQIAVRTETWESPPDQLEQKLVRLGCVACHTRGDRESRFQELAGQLVSLGPDQQLRDIAPPSLDAVGERLRPEWLHAVLTEHRLVRPWLAVKMPRYEKDDVDPLVDLLWRSEGLDPESGSSHEPTGSQTSEQSGKEIVGPTGLNCIGCHDFGERVPTGGVRAPDLTTVPQRLRFAWFRRWLHDPQSIAPGTRMPSNFRNGRSALPTVLDGSERAQVRALWGYLSDPDRDPPLLRSTLATVGESDTPIPTDRPLLVHGFLPGHAGLRGIALGFPDGVHFAFDSETCSLTRVWTGPFLHHEGWTGSGKGDVSANAITILGEIVWRDDSGQPVQILSSGEVVAPVEHRFVECWVMQSDAGFAWDLMLEGGQRVRVEERPSPMPELGINAFRRTLTVTDAPLGIQLAIRAGSVQIDLGDLPTGNVPVSEWMRVRQGSADWLVRRLNPCENEQWTVAPGRSEAVSSEIREVSLITTVESQSHVVELVYVRVPPGSEPPPLRGDLSSSVQRGIQP